MHPLFYRLMDQVEEKHWRYRYRDLLMDDFLDIHPPMHRRCALSIGCGTGGNLLFLHRQFQTVVGLDLSDYALSAAQRKSPASLLIRADANDVGQLFDKGCFDLILLSNVLYHQWVRSEPLLLEQVYRLLSSGGTVLIIEAAFPSLMREHDHGVMGVRRYLLKDITQWLDHCGFTQARGSYFNSISFFPAWTLALIDRWRGIDTSKSWSDETEMMEYVNNPFINRLATFILSWERAWIRWLGRCPFGTNIIIIASKP